MGMVRRRKHEERSGRITTGAQAAFEAGDWLRLHRELRLPPWQASPLDAMGECPWPATTAAGVTWAASAGLRKALSDAR